MCDLKINTASPWFYITELPRPLTLRAKTGRARLHGMMIPMINRGARKRKEGLLGTRQLIMASKGMQTRLVCQYGDLLASFPCQDG